MRLKIFIIVFGVIFGQIGMDSTSNAPLFDLSNKFKINIPGIIPKTMDVANKYVLLPHEIDAIKQRAKEYLPDPVSNNDIVILETNRGTMKLKLFPDIAPNHCNNFKKLANSGFYDHTHFHRIIPGFMIQGGDINSRDNDKMNDGHGGPGWTINAEFNDIPHKRGILSMARSSDPNSAGSQFFICVEDAPHLDGSYTVFGEVIDKVHIVDHIVNTPTEYDQAKRLSLDRIPKGEDPENWITFKDPKTRKKLYSKVPKGKKRSDYDYEMRKKIKSDSPSLIVKIEKVRVVNKNKLDLAK